MSKKGVFTAEMAGRTKEVCEKKLGTLAEVPSYPDTADGRKMCLFDVFCPWIVLLELIQPIYHDRPGRRGPKSMPLEFMLRVYFYSILFNRSNRQTEDDINNSPRHLYSFLRMSKYNLYPDHSTIHKFKKFLVTNNLEEFLFRKSIEFYISIGELSEDNEAAKAIDSTIIEAPTSTKNKNHERDPEMHQTKKGNEWHFGMKFHTAVDIYFGLITEILTTPANVSDVTVVHELINDKVNIVFLDSGYRGVQKRQEIKDRDERRGTPTIFETSIRKGARKKDPKPDKDGNVPQETIGKVLLRVMEQRSEFDKASLRSRVEHPFAVIKCNFGFRKTRFRGIKMNQSMAYSIAFCVNVLRIAWRAYNQKKASNM